MRDATLKLSAKFLVRINGVGHAKQEKVHKPRYIGLASFCFNDLDQLVVGGRVKFDQNLAYHAYARLFSIMRKRKRIKGVHGVLAHLIETFAVNGTNA